MTSLQIFHVLVAGHILTGATGLLAFWVPIVARKGGQRHRHWGRIFAKSMLATGSFAIGISIVTILDPVSTHPRLVDQPLFDDPAMIRGIFGWMMLCLAILTINLSWYGWLCVGNRRDHARNRSWHNLLLQALLTVASVNCAWQGHLLGQPLMIAAAGVGLATVATNLRFMLRRQPGAAHWQLEHIKALVGAGISVYTAFFAFGAVRLMPELALYPAYWAIPLIIGLAIIIYQQRSVINRLRLAGNVGTGAAP